jgi:hypothetical protein
MDVVWDGIVLSKVLNEGNLQVRQDLANAAKNYQWPRVLMILCEHEELVNTTRPDGSSLYASLHQAAHGGAPGEVIQRLVELGAWRTLQNARGERPLDIAEKQGHLHLLGVLAPELKRRVPYGILLKVQSHFHAVIRGRAGDLVKEACLRLPELEPLLELDSAKMWFPIPGKYGGFSYRLETDGSNAKLVAESWCRVSGGSGQRHEITSAGSKLVAEGFV